MKILTICFTNACFLVMLFSTACSTLNNNTPPAANTSTASNAPALGNNTTDTMVETESLPEEKKSFLTSQDKSTFKLTVAPNSILRIEGTPGDAWDGVRGCCSVEDIEKYTARALNRFKEEKIKENPNLMVHDYGWTKRIKNCPGTDISWDNERSCKASITLFAYIEFVRPEPEIRYSYEYFAIKNTRWYSHPAAGNAETGIIKKGESVYFSEEPTRSGSYQLAKIKDGTIQIVDSLDFANQ